MTTWLNANSPTVSAIAAAISAITSAIIVWLTCSLRRYAREQAQWTEESAKTTAALKEIERQRDASSEPSVFIFYDGHHPETGVGTFVMQNSGLQSLFLRSLGLYSDGLQVEMLNMDLGPKNDRALVPVNEIRDLVITPQKVEKFYFKFKQATGSNQFELLAQRYIGPPVRIRIDPSQLNGYELRLSPSTGFKAYRDGKMLNLNGVV